MEGIIFEENPFDTTGHFRPQTNAVFATKIIISYDDISAGNTYVTAIRIAAGLDYDAVITGAEMIVFCQYKLAGFNVQSVIVVKVAVYFHPANRCVRGVYQMVNPEGGVFGRVVFQQNTFGMEKLDKRGAKKMPFTELPLLHRHTVKTHSSQRMHVSILLFVPVDKSRVCIAVYCAFTCDSHIFHIGSVNHW